MAKDGCPFCSPYLKIVKSNEHSALFFSDPRKVPGQMLVIPKRHIEEPKDLTIDELKDIFDLIFFVEEKLIGKIGDGFDIRQNYRPFMLQSRLKIDHIHFHIIPRSNKDYLYDHVEKYETDMYVELDDSEAKAIAKLLGAKYE